MTSIESPARGAIQSQKKSTVLAQRIVDEIIGADMKAGDRLPPEADMCTTYGVGRSTIREALRAKEEGKEKVILMNWSGHGLMDLTGYEAFFDGKLHDYDLPEEMLARFEASMDGLPMP